MRRPHPEAQQRGSPLAPSFPSEEVTHDTSARSCCCETPTQHESLGVSRPLSSRAVSVPKRDARALRDGWAARGEREHPDRLAGWTLTVVRPLVRVSSPNNGAFGRGRYARTSTRPGDLLGLG
jgi:hypothetical protein